MARLGSDAVPLLLCIYRAYAHAAGPAAKSLTSVVQAQLVQYGHALGSTRFIPAGERDDWDSAEAEASRIWSMATADAPAVAEIDRDAEQRHATAIQINRVNDARSVRADRDASRAAMIEAAENAKFEAAIKAAEREAS